MSKEEKLSQYILNIATNIVESNVTWLHFYADILPNFLEHEEKIVIYFNDKKFEYYKNIKKVDYKTVITFMKHPKNTRDINEFNGCTIYDSQYDEKFDLNTVNKFKRFLIEKIDKRLTHHIKEIKN